MIIMIFKCWNSKLSNCNTIPVSVQKTRTQVSMAQSLELTYFISIFKAEHVWQTCLLNESDVTVGTFLETEMFSSWWVFKNVFNKDSLLSSSGHAVATGSSFCVCFHDNFHRLWDFFHILKHKQSFHFIEGIVYSKLNLVTHAVFVMGLSRSEMICTVSMNRSTEKFQFV